MPFELVRCGLPNIAAVVALALVPLVALPMHRHHVSAKAQTVAIEQVEQNDVAAVSFAYDIAD